MPLLIDIPLHETLEPAAKHEWESKLRLAHAKIARGAADGEHGYGWFSLPGALLADTEQHERLMHCANGIRSHCGTLVVLGAGGSFLGGKAVADALAAPGAGPDILYAGHDLSARSMRALLHSLDGRDFMISVVSKSGTTAETDTAFRLLRQLLEQRYGTAGARSRIFVTTGPHGPLRTLAQTEGYECFEIPDNIGGRFSVFTPAGLLPAAVAGVDIHSLLRGAAQAEVAMHDSALECGACTYAVWRGLQYIGGRQVEFITAFEPALEAFLHWCVQLFAESEGKAGRGILPTVALYTRDLHSLGQYIQQGPRNMFETVFTVRDTGEPLTVPGTGHTIQQLQAAATSGTLAAHRGGGVPCGEVILGGLDEHSLGCTMQTLMYACALSATLLGVNPFDQPGVEAYKNNMAAILAGTAM